MSRIGKSPIPIPDKVNVTLDGLAVTVKGPKGELKRTLPEGCLLYTSPSPRDVEESRMPSSA